MMAMELKTISFRLAAFLVLATVTASAHTQVSDSRPVTLEQKQQAVAKLAGLLRELYVLGDVAEKVAATIEQKLESGAYDDVGDARSFADRLTVDLQAVTEDKHLRVGEAPQSESTPTAPTDPEAVRAARRAAVRRSNNGFLRAEVLPGNVGYLDFRRFQSPGVAGDTLVATMAFFANVDAFILDLRNCRGGSAFTVPYVTAYFFSGPTHLYDMVFRGDNVTEHFWTHPYVPGERLADVPMFILTSAYTFSGAESVAYRFQVLKRATVVGERTGGGANAGGVRDVAPFFRVYMPMGRPVDPDTGTNWEGSGVEPDIVTSAREALVVAHIAALEALRKEATDETDRKRLDWAIRRAEADRNPVNLSPQDLERFAGNYGPARVWVEGWQLRYQRETGAQLLLTPLSATTFYSEARDPTQIEFILHPDGRVDRLVLTDDAGRREEFPISR
jgi:hypothetical protein